MQNNNISYRVEQAKDGYPTLAVLKDEGKPFYLHSRYSPLKEAEQFIAKLDPSRYDILVVLGTGLGYHLAPLKDKQGYSQIILLDVLDDIKNKIAEIVDVKFLTTDPRIIFLTGKEAGELEDLLPPLLDLENSRGVQVLEHVPSFRAFPEYYSDAKETVRRLITRTAGNLATREAFGSLYLRNSILNMANLSACRPVKNLFNSMEPYPVVVVTSGPSLDDSIQLLTEEQANCFIIAVDSALPVLSKQGIYADLVVTIDPQPYIYEHFAHARLNNTLPVYMLSSGPNSVRNRPGYVSLNSHPLAQLLDELFPGTVGSINSVSGTVAGDALYLAHCMGFGIIGLIGFDFCFPRFSIYARGSAYQQRFAAYFQNRFYTVESQNMNYIMKSSRGYRYEDRFSRKSFIQYKESLESLIRKIPIINVVSLDDRGIPLKGVDFLSAKDFFQTRCSVSIKKERLLSSCFSSSSGLGEVFSMEEIMRVLKNSDVLMRVLRASLNDTVDDNLVDKFKLLLKHCLENI